MSQAVRLRNLMEILDRVHFKFWFERLNFNYRLWGIEERQRQLNQVSSRYLAKALVLLGAQVDSTATIKPGLKLDNSENLAKLQIGARVYLGPGVFLDLAEGIKLGDEVVIAPEAMILTHGDVGARMLAAYLPRQAGAVVLGKGCWIGARAVILPGVMVGEGAVVGAGAIVTEDVPSFTVVVGVPARMIRKIETKGL